MDTTLWKCIPYGSETWNVIKTDNFFYLFQMSSTLFLYLLLIYLSVEFLLFLISIINLLITRVPLSQPVILFCHFFYLILVCSSVEFSLCTNNSQVSLNFSYILLVSRVPLCYSSRQSKITNSLFQNYHLVPIKNTPDIKLFPF